MTEYYSFSTDFPNGLDSSKIDLEINNSNISSTLIGVTRADDSVMITFNQTLSVDDKTTLNTIVSQHIPNPPIQQNKYSLTIVRGTNSNEYELICAFPVNDQYTFNMEKITITSKLTGAITNYSVRVYDATNNAVIAESTFTNNEFDILDMGSLSNIPTETAMFEIHAKKSGGDDLDKITISEITIYGN